MPGTSPPITIDRCVCFGKTFAEIQRYARERGITDLDQLRDELSFGHGCTCCLPYVEKSLRTGTTVFHQLIDDAG